MDCRETQTLLTSFHDGELPGFDRKRVEDHLRGCPACRALLADLARADAAAIVPDPGPGYWDRFNARVTDRVEREAKGPQATVLRPKRGWVRQQLRYLVPAVAAAAMVVMVVRYGGLTPDTLAPAVSPTARDGLEPGRAGMPTDLQSRPMGREPATGDSAGQRMAKAERETDGQGWPGAQKMAEGAAATRRLQEESNRFAEAPAPPFPPSADERSVTGTRGEGDRLADRALSEEKERTSRYRASAPAGIDAPAPAADSRLAEKKESVSGMRTGKDQAAEAPAAAILGNARSKADPSPLASASPRVASPCERARDLAAQGRFRDAEAAQRACLAKDRTAPAQEKGLVFLAELLDRQDRFADADAVLAEVHRQFPESRPLDLYRQQRPMVQRRP